MRNPLQRIYGRGDLHFVTFSYYRRRPYLGSKLARDRFVKVLNEVRTKYRFLLVGYVVMPEHVHLLLSESGKGNPSKVLQVIKQRVDKNRCGEVGKIKEREKVGVKTRTLEPRKGAAPKG